MPLGVGHPFRMRGRLAAVGLIFAASATACGHGGRVPPTAAAAPSAAAAPPAAATTGTPVATVAQPSALTPFAAFDTSVRQGGCPAPAKCYLTVGRAASVGGVGPVDEQHVLMEHDSNAGCATFSGTALWQVAGKGTITFAVETPDCLPARVGGVAASRDLDYVVTGGTGAFEGASGRGQLRWIPSGGATYDLWTGSLGWKNGRATPEGSSRASHEP